MLDLKIVGAEIIDGTGGPAFTGDVGIIQGRIVEVGCVPTQATKVINADGAVLTPGFIDPHTHYDGQALWDDLLIPSCRHGVTTAFLGNCGIGFAPLAPGGKEDLITLMEGVEDIPASVLEAGMSWNWETFSDYLNELSERSWPIDIATQIAHDPVRIYVMGERGMNREPATDEDIARMSEVVSDALAAGAFGFSTGRNDAHRMADGRDTPASLATVEELVGISKVLKKHGHRVLQLTSDFDVYSHEDGFDNEFELILNMARTAGSPVSLNLVQRPDDNDLWRLVMEKAAEASAQGINIVLQVAPKGVGVLMGLTTSFHPFVAHPSFQSLANLPLEECVNRLRRPEVKAKILSEKPRAYAGQGNAISDFHENLLQGMDAYSSAIFPDRGERNFEPSYEESLKAEAERRGISPTEAAYDALLEKEGEALLYWPAVNFGSGNLDNVREILLHPQSILGLGDSGAHMNSICDYSYSTFALSFWPNRKNPGPGIPVERIVHLMTGAQASHFGLKDRGIIEPGRLADLNLIDPEKLGLKPIRVVDDLPGGGKRLLQESQGYIATFKNGIPIVENDSFKGERPGRLLRAS